MNDCICKYLIVEISRVNLVFRDALAKENKELEKIIVNLDKELAYIKSSFPQNIGKYTKNFKALSQDSK